MKGWYNERYRHSLAARGIPTKGHRTSLEPDITKVTNPYDIQELKDEVQALMNKFKGSPEDLINIDTEDSYSLFIHTIAAGHQGTHQPSIIADFFDLKIPADAETAGGYPTADWDEWEFAWEEIDRKADEIADIINRESRMPGTFYFGGLEGYDDYGLYYIWDKGNHADWDIAVKKRMKERPEEFNQYWDSSGHQRVREIKGKKNWSQIKTLLKKHQNDTEYVIFDHPDTGREVMFIPSKFSKRSLNDTSTIKRNLIY